MFWRRTIFEKVDKFKNLVDCEIGDYLDKRDFA